MSSTALEFRAARLAALGEETRLAIVDELRVSDRSPRELRRMLRLESNLLAHHLDVLEREGLVERSRSSGDGRLRYVHLCHDALDGLLGPDEVMVGEALFVCTASSARSQLAAALWQQDVGQPATAAGTHPAAHVHPGAVEAAQRAGLDISDARPRHLAEAPAGPALVITVCDRAHEELDADPARLHWSVPDPVPDGSPRAFDAALEELRLRIGSLVGARRGAA